MNMQLCKHVAVAAIVIAAVSPVLAQSGDQPSPAFEAASIRPNTSNDVRSRVSGGRGGMVTATNVTLRTLIRQSYGILSSQIVGAPAWIDNDRFDLTARAEGEISEARLMPMMRGMLADRFKLATHIEKRALDVYALVNARADGTPGQELRRSDIDCATLGASVARGAPRPPDGPGTRATQGQPIGPCDTRVGSGTLAARATTMERLARNLTASVDRMVVDHTRLSGSFDVDLIWSPEGASESSGGSIFTALQEQLGLKLVAARAPVDVLVIDHVERPSPD
jgi:uncharacterized protein (TIGR03435 family)